MKPKIYCPHCNVELRWGDKFCGNCGKQIEWTDPDSRTTNEGSQVSRSSGHNPLACETCGTVNKPGTELCRTCGSALGARANAAPQQTSGGPKQSRREPQPPKKAVKPNPLLNSWKPVAAVVVIVVLAIAIDKNSSEVNIPEQIAPQQTAVPQQPATANMAALPQIEDMEKQVKANPADMAMTLQLANFLSDNRFYDKAITYYQAYLQKKPKDTNARVDMGICYKEIGQYDNATREMKKALEYDPAHLFATFNLGIVMLDEGKMYMDQGQMGKANELIKESSDWFKKTVELSPSSEVGKRAQQLLSQHSNTQLPQSN